MQSTAWGNLTLQLHLIGLDAHSALSDRNVCEEVGIKHYCRVLACTKPLVELIELQRLVMVMHACNAHSREGKAGG